MSSPKQDSANRLNAQHSTGPKSEAGRRRVAVNARQHGLTTTIDDSPWGIRVPDIALLLQAEGYDPFKANQLARKIAEYERNVAYQRERFLSSLSGVTPDPVVPSSAQVNIDLALKLAKMRIFGSKGTQPFEPKLSKQIERLFAKTAERQVRDANRDATQALKNADRHLRRAANQMIKQLRGTGA